MCFHSPDAISFRFACVISRLTFFLLAQIALSLPRVSRVLAFDSFPSFRNRALWVTECVGGSRPLREDLLSSWRARFPYSFFNLSSAR